VFHGSLTEDDIVITRPTRVTLDANNQAICPEDHGVFEDPDHCDIYWKCSRGLATEVYCDDGLVFDIKKAATTAPCDSPHVVHCGDRQLLQEPTHASEFCPRQFGTFEHPDPTVCGVYYSCENGKHTEVPCANGLHFNGTQGSCNWPRIAMREGCVEQSQLAADGTEICPPGPHKDANGQVIPHPSYPDLEDCSKFTVCLNGVTPQAASCDKGLVFDSRSMLCAIPDTVPECVGWYAQDPQFSHYYEDVPVGGADPGRADVVG